MGRIIGLVLLLAAAGMRPAAGDVIDGCWQDQDIELQREGCTAAIASGQWSGADLAPAYYNRANAYANLGDPQRALSDYDEAIRRDPRFALAYMNRGIALQGLGQFEAAIADHDEMIRLDPTYAAAFINRGYAFYQTGQNERAIVDLDEAIRLDPTLALAYDNRALARCRLGDAAGALADWDSSMARGSPLWPADPEAFAASYRLDASGLFGPTARSVRAAYASAGCPD